MIEGFPRSGTSFAVQAMLQANPDLKGRIATHIHTTPHLIRATQLRVPGMVLIREPASAVPSMAALGIQTGKLNLASASDAEIAEVIAQITRRYVAFHTLLNNLQNELMIVRFEQATTNFGVVVDRFNMRFGTAFRRFEHTSQATIEILERHSKSGKLHLGPNVDRDRIKLHLSAHYEAASNAQYRRSAEKAYNDCLAAATAT